jgi:hypothetical protein
MIDRLDTCNPDREESSGKPTNGETQLPNGKAMTREEIIRMAREAGFADGVVDIVGFEGFAKFANLVAAHKRPWIGLTNEEIMDCTHHMAKNGNETWIVTDSGLFEFAHILEEMLKGKNK